MKITHKGAYEYAFEDSNNWAKDFSARVIAKAAEAFLVHGTPIDEFIHEYEDTYDFFMRAKTPGGSTLVCRDSLLGGEDVPLQKVTRYYASLDGVSLIKIMPPLAKAPEHWREIRINKSEAVTIINDTVTIDRDTIDFDYYIQKVKEITDVFTQTGVSP